MHQSHRRHCAPFCRCSAASRTCEAAFRPFRGRFSPAASFRRARLIRLPVEFPHLTVSLSPFLSSNPRPRRLAAPASRRWSYLPLRTARLISQSMGITRGAPPTCAACPPPLPPPSSTLPSSLSALPDGPFTGHAHHAIQPSVLPSTHKMTLELTEWSSIWIFTAYNRQ